MKTFLALRCKKDYVKKNGRSLLYLLVGIDSTYEKIPLNLDWPWQLVDEANNRLLPHQKKDTECNDYNLIIRDRMGRCNEIFVEFRLKGKELTISQFLELYHDYEKRKDFILYMEAKIQERYRNRQISLGTRNSHRNTLLWLKQFRPTIQFQELNKKFIEAFAAWLNKQDNRRSKDFKKLDTNTIANVLKYVKAYIALAIEDEVPIENPFKTARVKTEQDQKIIDHLRPEEVARLMELYETDLPLGEKLTLCRFLIAATLSLRISDILRIDATKLEYYKAARKLIFHPKKQVITKKLKTIYVAIDDIALGYLTDCVELQQQAIAQGMQVSEAYGRKVLKKLAAKAGVKISGFHTGRHSFGTNYLRAGGRLTNLQHIMGHSNIITTMKYVHIVEEDTEGELLLLSNLYQKYKP